MRSLSTWLDRTPTDSILLEDSLLLTYLNSSSGKSSSLTSLEFTGFLLSLLLVSISLIFVILSSLPLPLIWLLSTSTLCWLEFPAFRKVVGIVLGHRFLAIMRVISSVLSRSNFLEISPSNSIISKPSTMSSLSSTKVASSFSINQSIKDSFTSLPPSSFIQSNIPSSFSQIIS